MRPRNMSNEWGWFNNTDGDVKNIEDDVERLELVSPTSLHNKHLSLPTPCMLYRLLCCI